jgi:hypothetical protein
LSLLEALVGKGLWGLLFSGFVDMNSVDTFPLIRMATFEAFGGLGRGEVSGSSFSAFGDLNFSDTFPLVQMATFELLETLLRERSPGAPFSGFGDLNSSDTFPLVQMPTLEPFGGPCGEDSSADFKA